MKYRIVVNSSNHLQMPKQCGMLLNSAEVVTQILAIGDLSLSYLLVQMQSDLSSIIYLCLLCYSRPISIVYEFRFKNGWSQCLVAPLSNFLPSSQVKIYPTHFGICGTSIYMPNTIESDLFLKPDCYQNCNQQSHNLNLRFGS